MIAVKFSPICIGLLALVRVAHATCGDSGPMLKVRIDEDFVEHVKLMSRVKRKHLPWLDNLEPAKDLPVYSITLNQAKCLDSYVISGVVPQITKRYLEAVRKYWISHYKNAYKDDTKTQKAMVKKVKRADIGPLYKALVTAWSKMIEAERPRMKKRTNTHSTHSPNRRHRSRSRHRAPKPSRANAKHSRSDTKKLREMTPRKSKAAKPAVPENFLGQSVPSMPHDKAAEALTLINETVSPEQVQTGPLPPSIAPIETQDTMDFDFVYSRAQEDYPEHNDVKTIETLYNPDNELDQAWSF